MAGFMVVIWISFFRPYGASSKFRLSPRLAPWAAFFRRFAACSVSSGGKKNCASG